jgi:hypothetical protein
MLTALFSNGWLHACSGGMPFVSHHSATTLAFLSSNVSADPTLFKNGLINMILA